MIPRPLDVTEAELLQLLGADVREGVFSEPFLAELRKVVHR